MIKPLLCLPACESLWETKEFGTWRPNHRTSQYILQNKLLLRMCTCISVYLHIFILLRCSSISTLSPNRVWGGGVTLKVDSVILKKRFTAKHINNIFEICFNISPNCWFFFTWRGSLLKVPPCWNHMTSWTLLYLFISKTLPIIRHFHSL